jgi:large subunit ribosomal protein L25
LSVLKCDTNYNGLPADRQGFCEVVMSDTIVLKAEVRKDAGTKHAKVLRKTGKLPAIVYGHKKGSVALAFNARQFVATLHHGHRLFDVQMDTKTETMLVKALQYDHLGKDIIHADLVRVDLAERVKVTVPIELRGTSAGSHEGGIIDEHLANLEIECTVASIPEFIEVSIKEINIGDAVHAKDIELPAGAKLITNPEALILTCHLVAAAKSTEELEEDMPTAPEVITERDPDEESEEKKQE